jgi:hypothetical protein
LDYTHYFLDKQQLSTAFDVTGRPETLRNPGEITETCKPVTNAWQYAASSNFSKTSMTTAQLKIWEGVSCQVNNGMLVQPIRKG